MNQRIRHIPLLLTPSLLSGLVVVVSSLMVVVGLVVALRYQGSSLQYWHDTQAAQAHAISANYTSLDNTFSKNVILSDLPLLVLWGGVGAIVYSITMNLVGTYNKINDLKQEMNYVHANRNALLKVLIERVVTRSLALIVWIVFIRFTIRALFPYVTALTYAGSGSGSFIQNGGYVLLALAVSAIALHVHVILLRLSLLKTRIFSHGG